MRTRARARRSRVFEWVTKRLSRTPGAASADARGRSLVTRCRQWGLLMEAESKADGRPAAFVSYVLVDVSRKSESRPTGFGSGGNSTFKPTSWTQVREWWKRLMRARHADLRVETRPADKLTRSPARSWPRSGRGGPGGVTVPGCRDSAARRLDGLSLDVGCAAMCARRGRPRDWRRWRWRSSDRGAGGCG